MRCSRHANRNVRPEREASDSYLLTPRPAVVLSEHNKNGEARPRPRRQMEHENPQVIEYRAQDGARASFRLFPADDRNAPVVICIPGMGVRGRYYTDFARMLSGRGFHVLTSDLRGIDSSSVRASRRCDFGYEEIINLDFPALVDAARQRFPSNGIILLGHSLG